MSLRRTITTGARFNVALPPEAPTSQYRLASLARTKANCLYLHKRVPPFNQLVPEYSNDIINRPSQQLVTAFVTQGDGEAALEISLRLYTGCTVQANVEVAIDILHAIIDQQHPAAVHDAPRFLLARAFSFLTLIHYDLHEDAHAGRAVAPDPYSQLPPERRYVLPTNVPDIYLANVLLRMAAVFANETAKYGFVTPYVLHVSQSLVRFGERDGIDVRNDPRFRNLAHLWRVHDIRRREMLQEQMRRDRKVAKIPNAYVCASAGCGVSAMKRVALKACSGRCPLERKPRYCSKECQAKDWKAHKAVCKPDDELEADVQRHFAFPTSSDGTMNIEGQITTNNVRPSPDEMWSRDGQARSIELNVPGHGSLNMESTDLTPAYLKWMRAEISAARTELPSGNGFLFRAGDVAREVIGQYYSNRA